MKEALHLRCQPLLQEGRQSQTRAQAQQVIAVPGSALAGAVWQQLFPQGLPLPGPAAAKAGGASASRPLELVQSPGETGLVQQRPWRCSCCGAGPECPEAQGTGAAPSGSPAASPGPEPALAHNGNSSHLGLLPDWDAGKDSPLAWRSEVVKHSEHSAGMFSLSHQGVMFD